MRERVPDTWSWEPWQRDYRFGVILVMPPPPFEVHYGRPTASARPPGVAYPVSPQERFEELKRIIHQASVFEGVVYRRREIPAHMTIAEFLTIEDSLRICADLSDTAPRGSFWCDRLEHVVPDATFRFQRRGTFFLGTSR